MRWREPTFTPFTFVDVTSFPKPHSLPSCLLAMHVIVLITAFVGTELLWMPVIVGSSAEWLITVKACLALHCLTFMSKYAFAVYNIHFTMVALVRYSYHERAFNFVVMRRSDISYMYQTLFDGNWLIALELTL